MIGLLTLEYNNGTPTENRIVSESVKLSTVCMFYIQIISYTFSQNLQ